MTPTEALLKERVRTAGRITFAEFMEAALYHPDAGYYTRPGRISARGDFYTSPSVHPAFGALICLQLNEMWVLLEKPREFGCIEFGAAAGTLATDITNYASRIGPDFADALSYRTIDRAVSGTFLASLSFPRNGCVLSNELLDAFPVHRFVVENGHLQELYVHLSGDRFVERPGEPSSPEIERRLSGLAHHLPDGFEGEVSLGIDEWAGQVRNALGRGFVLTIDFGYDRDALYSPERVSGTLRCYYRHTVTGDPFKRVGEQDIAAHVDFTEVDRALAGAGLSKLGHTSQAQFLRRLGAGAFLSRLPGAVQTPGDIARNRAAILELLKPEGLGGFRVVVHGRNVGAPRLTGLSDPPGPAGPPGPTEPADREDRILPVPVLAPGDDRVPVLEGRYPHAGQELTGTWDDLLT